MFKNLSELKERAKSLMNELTKTVQDFDVQYTDEINNRYDVNLDEILDTMERKIVRQRVRPNSCITVSTTMRRRGINT